MMEKEAINISIENKIFIIRGQKVMFDVDLANIYGVLVKRLNEQVKRNISRFPDDFMFQLTKKEKEEVVANCDHLSNLRFSPHLPYVFTELGVSMLSSVLNSSRAIQMNIFIIRAFVKIREVLAVDKNLEIALLEFRLELNKRGKDIEDIQILLKKLTDYAIKPIDPIGFVVPDK